MSIKKTVSVIAAAAIGLSLLGGCQSASPTATEPQEQAAFSDTTQSNLEEDFYEDLDLEEIYNQVTHTKNDDKWELPLSGCTFILPEDFRNLKGQVFPYDVGETGAGSGVFHCRLFYVPSPDESREALAEAFGNYDPENNPDGSSLAAVAEMEAQFQERGSMPFLDILVFNEAFSLEEAQSEAWISESSLGESIDLGQKGSYKYYCLTRNYTSMAGALKESFTDAYYDEFMSLVESADRLADNITATQPASVETAAPKDAAISFETRDLDGNVVSSKDLFTGHKVTMINIWATWCGPCVEELPGLEKLNTELLPEDCQVIGICDDTLGDPQAISEAKAILAETGVTYTNLVQTEELREMLPIPAYPISYFVDSEGRILTSPEVGANLNAYRSRIDKVLIDLE